MYNLGPSITRSPCSRADTHARFSPTHPLRIVIKKQREGIPEDFPKLEVAECMLKTLGKFGLASNLRALVVCDEPCKKSVPGGECRARHKHMIMQMKDNFAHSSAETVADALGVASAMPVSQLSREDKDALNDRQEWIPAAVRA